jgi:hypothetical protein
MPRRTSTGRACRLCGRGLFATSDRICKDCFTTEGGGEPGWTRKAGVPLASGPAVPDDERRECAGCGESRHLVCDRRCLDCLQPIEEVALPADGRCRECDAEVSWQTTAKGNAIPINPHPAPEGRGNFKIGTDGVAHYVHDSGRKYQTVYETHFATCKER